MICGLEESPPPPGLQRQPEVTCPEVKPVGFNIWSGKPNPASEGEEEATCEPQHTGDMPCPEPTPGESYLLAFPERVPRKGFVSVARMQMEIKLCFLMLREHQMQIILLVSLFAVVLSPVWYKLVLGQKRGSGIYVLCTSKNENKCLLSWKNYHIKEGGTNQIVNTKLPIQLPKFQVSLFPFIGLERLQPEHIKRLQDSTFSIQIWNAEQRITNSCCSAFIIL